MNHRRSATRGHGGSHDRTAGRRRFAALAPAMAAAWLAGGMLAAPLHAASDDRPNIVLIMADDMGFSDIGCYGGEIHTPTLDRLAAGGVRFAQFYNTGRCCPTRAALLTGLYPHQAGVGHMMDDRGHDGYRGDLNRNCVTIAEVLRAAGYSTYMTGKWHVTKATQPDGPKDNWPLQRGFDRFYGTITGAGSFFDPGTLTRENTMISPLADPEYQPDEYYYTHAISDHAVRYIDEHHANESRKEKPFFLYVAYTAAHWPMHALERDIAKYRGKYDGGYAPIRAARLERLKQMGLIDPRWQPAPLVGNWDSEPDHEWEARCMEVYAAMIDSMDQGIGRVVASLERNGQLQNTLILFLQDNGGCQETVGRRGDFARPVAASLPKIADQAIRLDVIPKQNRAGVPTLTGPGIMPGPEDTYIAYGLNWANVSNTPYREYKHFVHEGGISTPLVAHWPAGIERRGALEHQPGHLIDVMATCVAVSGADYPRRFHNDQAIASMEGASLLPALRGQGLERRNPIFWEHEGNRAIRDGKWKLVAKENRPWELYDIDADRPEMNDLADQHPQLVEQLGVKWDGWAARARVLPVGTWRGTARSDAFNKEQKLFELAAGDELDRSRAPFVPNKPLKITAQLERMGDGVVVAQGGTAAGYSLYVAGGRVCFAARHAGQLTVVESTEALEPSSTTVIATLARNGSVRLSADGRVVAEGSMPGPLDAMPVDGLQIGRDTGGAVGRYDAPNPFEGSIHSVQIVVGPQARK